MNLKDFSKKALATVVMSMLCLVAFAQTQAVTGVVTDDLGDPLVGVSVSVKGTTNGAVTDLDGNYSLKNVKATDVLVFSYIGFSPKEMKVGNQTKIDLQMKEDQTSLEEVVVVGYGTMKKKDLTGSVTTVGSDKLVEVPVANAAEALQGKMAGVQISVGEGSPDASVSIRVRGGGSITQSNEPLYIVDGFPVDNINDIPSSDIEDITVLKDASSTAIYGSRGANGVILVTTKSGKEGKINIAYNAYYSIKRVAKRYDVLSTGDYARWTYEHAALKSGGEKANPSEYTKFFGNWEDIDLYDGIAGNDWQDQTFGRTGHTFNHNISVNGGTEKVKYNASYSMMNDKAIMLASNYRRDNFNVKLQGKLNKAITLDLTARYSRTDVRGAGSNAVNDAGSTSESRMRYAVIYPMIPIAGLTDADATETDPDFSMYNPIDVTYDNDRRQLKKQLNLNGSLTWKVIKGLTLKTEVGFDDYNNEDDRFYGLTTYWIKNNGYVGPLSPGTIMKRGTRERLRNTNTVNYDFSNILPVDHSLNILAGEEYIIAKSKLMTNTVIGLPDSFKAEDAWKLSSQGQASSINNYYNPDDKLLSFFGRLNYNYKGRYLVSATVRADGSSKFSKGNKWGVFPSAAVAWRLSDEPFMEKTRNWLDDLKIRFSFGTAGNNGIPEGMMVQSYASNSTNNWLNGFNSYWAPAKVMANPDLKWETTITRNLGLDFSFLNGMINGTFDVYLNSTNDLLINFPVSGTGYDTQYRNMGKTENKGLEFSINVNPIRNKNYELSIGANISLNRGKIVSLGDMDDFGASTGWASTDINNDYWIAVGGQVGEIRGFRSAGRYEVSDFEGYDQATKKWVLKEGVPDATSIVGIVRPGTMKIQDVSGDGKIDANDNTIIGNTNPKFTGGFNISGRVYGFDLSANFTYSVGNDVYNADKVMFTQTSKYRYSSMISDMAEGNRWTNLRADGTISNDPEELARMNANTTMWSPYTTRYVLTDYYVEKASFLRLSTLTVGYSFPKSLISKIHVQNIRLYFTAHNLFCVSGYSGLDPEVNTRTATPLTPNVDYSAYPKSRQFVFGINLNF